MGILKEPYECSNVNVLFVFPFVKNQHKLSDYLYVVLGLLRLKSLICRISCLSLVIEGILPDI